MKTWTKYLVEISVITFSILAAFWLEQWRENNQEEKRRNEALKLVLEEIKLNYSLAKENLSVLHEFNEYCSVVTALTKKPYSEGEFFQIHADTIKSIKAKHPDNKRIQRLDAREFHGTQTGDYSFPMHLDFLLASYNFSMWEAAKTSGALIGANPVVLAKLGQVYTAFEANLGFSETEYHRSLLSDFGENGSIEGTINATHKLEHSTSLRLVFLDKIYQETIDLVENSDDYSRSD